MADGKRYIEAALCPVCLARGCGHFTAEEKRTIAEFGWRSWADICCEDPTGTTTSLPEPRKTPNGWPRQSAAQ